MAISKIQYDDKVAINIDSTIPDINKCNASDLNEIKSVVNNNADEIPTISDEYGTSTADGYSQNYINENTINPSGEPSTSEEDVSSATFTNTLEAPMNIDLKGNTLQNGTPTPSSPIPVNVVSGDNEVNVCGKNLFDKDNVNYINGWISSTTMRLNTTNGNRMFYIPCKPNTTYTISRSIITSSFRTTTYDSTPFPTVTSSNVDYTVPTVIENNSGTTLTITTGANAKYLVVHYGKIEDTNLNETLASIQIEQGNQATTFEAYNGTTYNIDLPVENLIPTSTSIVPKYTFNISGAWVSNDNYLTIGDENTLIKVQPNTTYTFTSDVSITKYLLARIYNFTSSKTWISRSDAITITSNGFSFTTGSTTEYISIGLYTNGTAVSSDISQCQLEQGSKANTYTPYGTTPIELNKIGTYQDYIYKENDKWYLHKETGKYIFTGSENFTWDSDKQRIIIPISNLGINTPPLTTSQLFNIYNQKVIGTTFDNLYNKVVDNCIALSTGNSISIRSTGFDSLNTGKNTIANTDLHYILATPTNTEITYTPLIEQLESIKNAMSKEGTTNVNQVNNDLPFILDLSVFNDTYNGRYESLVEQIPNNDNLVNVGTYVNDNYKVNMLYSHNLCNGRSQGYYVNQGATGCGYSGTDSGLIIKVDGGNYTISTSTSQARYRIGVLDTIPTTNIAITLYNGLNKDGTSDTITIDTTGHSYLVVNATDLTKIFIAKGDTPTTEPYITPSINVDGEEIYNAGKGIITAGFSSDYVLATTNTYVDVPLNTTYSQLGTNFEINNGEIICKKDGYIKVSCHFNYLYIAGTGNKWITINLYHTSYNSLIYMNLTGTKDERADVNGTDRLVYVYAGDKLKIQNYGTQNDTLRALYSYITCEYV